MDTFCCLCCYSYCTDCGKCLQSTQKPLEWRVMRVNGLAHSLFLPKPKCNAIERNNSKLPHQLREVVSYYLTRCPSTSWRGVINAVDEMGAHHVAVLVCLTDSMPTGSGKSTLFRHLYSMMQNVHQMCGVTDKEPTWVFDDGSFEKMGS